MKRLIDRICPKDSLQLVLIKDGKPVAGLVSDDTGEVASPSLKRKKDEASRKP